MKRIMVIGNNGTGKSTFARRLSKTLGIPVIHLDAHFHQPNWTKPKPGEWVPMQQALMKPERWIIDGTYFRTLPIRAEVADTIVFLTVPKWRSLLRVIKRFFIYKNTHRPDLPKYLQDRVSLLLVYKLLTFSETKVLKHINAYRDKIIFLSSDDEMEEFLKNARV